MTYFDDLTVSLEYLEGLEEEDSEEEDSEEEEEEEEEEEDGDY